MAGELANDLHIHMLTNDFVWAYDEEKRTPTPEEIEDALHWMRQRLKDEPVGTSLFANRFIMHKATEDRYDVYSHFGDYNEHS